MTPRAHSKLIKAWADGAQIQVMVAGGWIDTESPIWCLTSSYRVKPEKKPDVVHYMTLDPGMHIYRQGLGQQEDSNLKATFDGDTGKLLSVEVIE